MEVPTLYFTPPQLYLDLWLLLAQELWAQSKAAFLLLLSPLPPWVPYRWEQRSDGCGPSPWRLSLICMGHRAIPAPSTALAHRGS